MKRSSIHGPPYSPGGSEMLWITMSEIFSPSGRSSQCGDRRTLSPALCPWSPAPEGTPGRGRSVDAKAVEAGAERGEGEAGGLGGGGLVGTSGLEGLGGGPAVGPVGGKKRGGGGTRPPRPARRGCGAWPR